MDNRRFIARRAAQYFNEGDTVNLGIGIPSACSDYVNRFPDRKWYDRCRSCC